MDGFVKILPELPPFNENAEEAVLGCILIDPEKMHTIDLLPQDFHNEQRRSIFRAMQKVEKIDFLSVIDALKRPDLGAYLTGLISVVPTSIHAEYYAKIVKRDSVRRQLITIAAELTQIAYKETDTESLLATANKLVSELNLNLPGGPVSGREIIDEFYDTVEEWAKYPLKDGAVRGLSTGYKDLDRVSGGLDKGEIYIISGRPGAGKSCTAFDIAKFNALLGYSVLIFSLEMIAQSVVSRWASSLSGIPINAIQAGMGDMVAHIEAIRKLSTIKNLWIDDQPSLTPDQVRARALKISRECGGLDLFVLDHCAKMRYEGKGENEATIEGRKTEAMKDLAKELRCPGLLVIQLNRGPEMRVDKHPKLSDLRQSGRHEEEASQVWGLYRDDYYDRESMYPNILEIEVLKNRHGPCGVANLYYDRTIQRLSDAEMRPIEKVF